MGITQPLPPVNAQDISGTAAGVSPTLPTVVTVQGIAGGIPVATTGGGGGPVDVSDRAGRLLGIISGGVNATQAGAWSVSVLNFPAIQPVSQSGAWSVAILGPVDVTGSIVAVSNFPAVQPVNDNGGSLTVDGTVAATQSGVWSISTTPDPETNKRLDDLIEQQIRTQELMEFLLS